MFVNLRTGETRGARTNPAEIGTLLLEFGTLAKLTGKPVYYDRDTLSDRIDGEAELYFPYGFDRMAAARYVSEKSPGTGVDVEIYRMGSLLDAFGIYANYRQNGGCARS